MSAEQLALIETPPVVKLTDRQQAVLAALTHAGHDGLTTDEAGAVAHGLRQGRWAHGPDDRCAYCGRDGRQLLLALKAKGLARYRAGRLKVWQLADLTSVAAPAARGMLPADQPIPF